MAQNRDQIRFRHLLANNSVISIQATSNAGVSKVVEPGSVKCNCKQQIRADETPGGPDTSPLQNGSNGSRINGANRNNSSITILTSTQNALQPTDIERCDRRSPMVVLHRLNAYCNNYSTELARQRDNLQAKICNKRTRSDLEPDSTTANVPSTPEKLRQEVTFQVKDDVLVKCQDELLYLGTIIAVSSTQCLVRFDDNTERWSSIDELTKLSTNQETDSAPVCVVCKRQSAGDTVEVCENCGRGYHIKCMHDGNNIEKNGGFWFCRRCTSPNGKRREIGYVSSGVLSESLASLTHKSQLPYDIDRITWDDCHLVNDEATYCYCGEDGDWMKEMLQCCRCKQWFHGRCIRSLQYPIFLGDRFYFFLCSICNHGHEFVRRLEISWPDLVHLILYNLTARNGKRFYDFNNAIIPYTEANWRTLQISEQMSKLSPSARKEIMKQTLANDRTRFRCGTEMKKVDTLFTLQNHNPPNPPPVSIPPGQIITEHILTRMALENRAYVFLPRVALERSLVNDAPSRERMTGMTYCNSLASKEDVSINSSQDVNHDEDASNRRMEVVAGQDSIVPTKVKDLNVAGDPSDVTKNSSANNNVTGGDSLFTSNAKDGRGDNKANPRVTVGNRRAFRYSKRAESEKSFEVYDSSNSTSRNTLDLIIPPPKNFHGRNNPFHLQQMPQVTLNEQVNGGPGKIGGIKIVNRQLSAGNTQDGFTNKRRRNNKSSMNGPKKTTSTIIPPATPNGSQTLHSNRALVQSHFSANCERSINPPFNSYQNNQNQLQQTQQDQPLQSSTSASSSGAIAEITNTVSGTATVTSPHERGSAHGRRLRQQPAQNYSDTRRRKSSGTSNKSAMVEQLMDPAAKRQSFSIPQTTLQPKSPISSNSSHSYSSSSSSSSTMGGLERTVSSNANMQSPQKQCLSATKRILSGEPYVVKARRILTNGEVQYLIEWGGSKSHPI